MKIRMTWGSLLGLLCLILTVCVGIAAAQGLSPSSPARVGVTVQSEVQCGDSAVSLEPYDVKLTLLQTVRGKEAWERIKAANASNQAPKAGFEYILAQIRFELKARIAPGDKSFDLGRQLQFTALTADGKEYEAAAATPPKPELGGKTRAGAAVEGWIVFLVEQKDGKPLMAFDPASGGATLRGRVLWFQLY
jgi:hypothetical protein